MNTKHEYKGFRIIKRGGRTHRTRAARTGYAIFTNSGSLTFSTLTEAKAWVDAKVGA